MNTKAVRFLLFSSVLVLLSALVAQAQTSSPTQGFPQVGPPSYAYAPLYVDATQFCTGGFNLTARSCVTGSMWQAIAAAASFLNISGTVFNTGVIDARAFQGAQLVTYGVGTTALYGGNLVGSQVNGVLLLGNVTNYCDGPTNLPPTGTYTDGSSNYGTPCIIVPWGFEIAGTAPLASVFAPCLGRNNPNLSGCVNAFPQRVYQIAGINAAGPNATQLTYTFLTGTFTTIGGPAGSQNIYPASASSMCPPPSQASGELVAITGAPSGENFLRTVQCATSTSLTIAVPSGTYAGCSSPPDNCGTAYLVTPLIGFGVQGTSYPYEPVRTGSSQSFGTRLINLFFDLSTYQGAVAAQNLNGGEQSGMDTIHCIHPSMGCVQVGPGANESGPYNNIYSQTLTTITNVNPTTFGIYNAAAGAGFHRMTITSSQTVPNSNHPTAAIYDDGPNVVFDGEPHNEGTLDTIDLAPNTSVYGVAVSGIAGPPSGNTGMNLVHILNDGYTVGSSTISNLTQQPGPPQGSTYAIADDINQIYVTDLALSRYELDPNGLPVSGAYLQANASGSRTVSIPTLNGSGYSGAHLGPVASGTGTPGYLATYTSSGTVQNCANLPCSPIIGVFAAPPSPPPPTTLPLWVTSGVAMVQLDATVNVSYNDILCASATMAGTAHDNGSIACTTGLWVGIATSAGPTSTPTALIVLK